MLLQDLLVFTYKPFDSDWISHFTMFAMRSHIVKGKLENSTFNLTNDHEIHNRF